MQQRARAHVAVASSLAVVVLLTLLQTGCAARHLRGLGLGLLQTGDAGSTSSGRGLPIAKGDPGTDGIPVFPGLNDTSKDVTVVDSPPGSNSGDFPDPTDPCLRVLNGTLASLLNSTLLTNVTGLKNGSHVLLLNSTVFGSNVTGKLLLLNVTGVSAWLNTSIADTVVGDVLNCTRARNCSLTWAQVLNSTLLELCASHLDSGSHGASGSTDSDFAPPAFDSSGGGDSNGNGPGDDPGPPVNSCPGCSVAQWDQYCADTGFSVEDPACQPVEIMCRCMEFCEPGEPGRVEPMWAPDYVGCAIGWERVEP